MALDESESLPSGLCTDFCSLGSSPLHPVLPQTTASLPPPPGRPPGSAHISVLEHTEWPAEPGTLLVLTRVGACTRAGNLRYTSSLPSASASAGPGAQGQRFHFFRAMLYFALARLE